VANNETFGETFNVFTPGSTVNSDTIIEASLCDCMYWSLHYMYNLS
jgi:hypothetical protein